MQTMWMGMAHLMDSELVVNTLTAASCLTIIIIISLLL